MKKVRNIILFVLVLCMSACLFAGCESEAEKIEALAGTWYITIDDAAETAEDILSSQDFYEEEIALIDLNSLQYSQTLTFTADKTYMFAYDAEGTQACIKVFLKQAFADLYEGRNSLNAVYDHDFDGMSEEEFYQFYADIYMVDNVDALIDTIVENLYDYDSWSEGWETGTYNIKGNKIMCTITGELEEEYLTYKIEGDQLTVTYVDGVEVYSRTR